MSKQRCDECGWRGTDDQVLRAPNPFDPEDTLYGCPDCKQVECLRRACDDPECWEFASCGWPDGDRYRTTCGPHYLERDVG